jgi:protein-S-isoprenylcysteine O-methyltransferase Ste14
MGLVQFPQWTPANIAVAALQVLGLGGCVQELQGENAGYSKFADPNKQLKVSSRTGMLLLYSPALLVALGYLKHASTVTSKSNGRETLTAGLLALHFGKRVWECSFLHKYSGTMDGDFLLPISSVYALTSTMIAHQQLQIAEYSHTASNALCSFGIFLFMTGQFGNFYHHYLLAELRRGKNASGERYVIPTGGLFKFVTMPHYFCEILAWLGIACVTQQLNAFLTVADMTSYLAGRSMATTRWYRSKFLNYPSERKHLIPFVF